VTKPPCGNGAAAELADIAGPSVPGGGTLVSNFPIDWGEV
jgi:hypothetical protein